MELLQLIALNQKLRQGKIQPYLYSMELLQLIALNQKLRLGKI